MIHSDWTSAATSPPTAPDLRSWLPPRIPPYVLQITDADYAGWLSAKPWDAPPKVFVTKLGTVADPVSEKLDALTQLEPNWDGHGGVSPPALAVAGAKSFYGLLPANVADPSVEPSGDGEVNLVWRRTARYLEIGVEDGGRLSYYGVIDGQELLGELPMVPTALPKELRIALAAFSNGRV